MKGNNNSEKIVLVLTSLLAIGGSAWFITKSQSFSEQLVAESITPKAEFSEVPIAKVDEALKLALADSKPWASPTINNKAVPLNKSVLLVLKDNQIFDLAVEEPMLRPPMTNSYLRENNLEFGVPNVGDLDADQDGFTNAEEFVAGTKPRDPKSHPAITDKLFDSERIAHNYRITLKTSSTPLQVSTPDAVQGERKNWFVDPGSDTEGGKAFGLDRRYIAQKFEKKDVPDPVIGQKDVSELTVLDTKTNETFVLVKDAELNRATYEARLTFRLNGASDFVVGKGKTFRLPGFDAVTYKVIDIKEDGVIIATLNADGTTGKEILVKKD